MSKFEIGSQWKTRGGHRAVIVEISKDGYKLLVWNAYMEETNLANSEGHAHSTTQDDRDLIEPWKEPVVHEGWLLIEKGGFKAYVYPVKQTITPGMREDYLACIPINFIEGEGL